MSDTLFTVSQSLDVLARHQLKMPSTMLILGSGWNALQDHLEVEKVLGFEEVFGVKASVPGHEGKLIIGALGKKDKKRIVAMVGRLHTYEGYTTEEVTRPLQVLQQLGVSQVVVTAACGALNERYQVGDFVIMNDVITAFCPSPLTGPRFTDLSQAFDARLHNTALQACISNQIPCHEGIYCYVRGPHFETPADKMLYHHLGADVIGMSTVPETIMAQVLGVKVVGLGFVTNLAFVKHDHQEVLAAAHEGSQRMVRLLSDLIIKTG